MYTKIIMLCFVVPLFLIFSLSNFQTLKPSVTLSAGPAGRRFKLDTHVNNVFLVLCIPDSDYYLLNIPL